MLTKLVVGLWAILSSAEWLMNLTLFRGDGLLAWEVVGLQKTLLLPSKVWERIAAPSGVRALLITRVLAGLGLMIPVSNHVDVACSLVILLSCFYLSWRTVFGSDGSDQMGLVLTLGVLLMSIGTAIEDTGVTMAGAVAIGGQSTIAYFAAGAAKLVSPVWRDGSAIRGVMGTQTYGHKSAARWLGRVPWLGLAVCWIVIITETAFPAVLFLPDNWFLAALAGFGIFHLINAYFMGLNLFVLTFVGTYPSVIIFAGAIRSVL